MLADERRFRISEILSQQRAVSASDLQDILGVTSATIRRDLWYISKVKVCWFVPMGRSLQVSDYQLPALV